MVYKESFRKVFTFFVIYFTCFSYTYASKDNWIKVLELEDRKITIYVNLTNIRSNNAFIYFWALKNNRITGTSKVELLQANCSKVVFRYLLTEEYKSLMAQDYTGTTIVDKDEYWIDGPVATKMLELPCSH